MKSKKEEKKIAKERVSELFDRADKTFQESESLTNRYVSLARKIAMKFNIRLTKYKRKFCKHCYHYLKSGVNSKTRIHKSKVIIYCENCKKYTRIPLKQKNGKNR